MVGSGVNKKTSVNLKCVKRLREENCGQIDFKSELNACIHLSKYISIVPAPCGITPFAASPLSECL